MKLYSDSGERLYLTPSERKRFEETARLQEREVMTFALTLLYTGCRISEALNLQVRHINLESNEVTIGSLKKRRDGVYRSVPIPERLTETLNLVHNLRSAKRKNKSLWTWSRMTGWRKITTIMEQAGIEGAHATPKGLRHAFGVYAIAECEIPLNLVQRWLGHADLKTTAIYANAIGKEERDIAGRMWK